ncbi:MAG: RNA pseudouridine synthase, partial [Oscillospiraceae bacterium]|nr:RNA pseudouridine synthase [Oscillospiraceae bacterium]
MTVAANESDAGVRLDIFVAGRTDLTRSQSARLIESGGVTLLGAVLTKNHRVTPNAVYNIILPEPISATAEAQDIALDVKYEDDDVIVVDKPRGMVVHPAPGHADGTL